MGLLEHFNTFGSYPGATVTHWLICAVAGWIVYMARNSNAIVFGIVLISWWCLYEVIEFVRIEDNCDIDLANGLFAFVVGVLIAVIDRNIAQPLLQPLVRSWLGK